MRALIVPELRKRWPGSRIIHELPLRYSSNRIDLAAVLPTAIVSVEIKSSKDVAARLEAQVRAFLPVSSCVIVALAPKWNEKLPYKEIKYKYGTGSVPQYTEAQETLRRIGASGIEAWTVCAEAGSIEVTSKAYHQSHPWPWHMLHMLHVAELVEIAGQHRIWQGKRPVHLNLVNACADLMTGREIIAAVCGALRARDAFAKESDPPALTGAP